MKKDKKLCGKNKDRDRIEELIEGFIKLILNDLTIVLDWNDNQKAPITSINFINIIFLLRKENVFTLPSSKVIIYINMKVRAEELLDTGVDINVMIEAVTDAAGLLIRFLNRV